MEYLMGDDDAEVEFLFSCELGNAVYALHADRVIKNPASTLPWRFTVLFNSSIAPARM